MSVGKGWVEARLEKTVAGLANADRYINELPSRFWDVHGLRLLRDIVAVKGNRIGCIAQEGVATEFRRWPADASIFSTWLLGRPVGGF